MTNNLHFEPENLRKNLRLNGQFRTKNSSTILEDQYWRFDDDGDGYFYIVNAYYDGTRLAKWGWGDKETGTYDNQLFPDQLWSLTQTSPGVFKICNKVCESI